MKRIDIPEGAAAFIAGCGAALLLWTFSHLAHAVAPPAPLVKDVTVGSHTVSIDSDCHVWEVDGGSLIPISSTPTYADYQQQNADWVIVNLYPGHRACKITVGYKEQMIFLKGVFNEK